MSRRARIRQGLGELARPFPAPAEARPEDQTQHRLAAAFEEGRRAGHDEAQAEIAAETAAWQHELARTLEALAEYRQEMTESHANSMKQLALDAASRIVRERIDAGDPVALRALQEALEAVPRNGAVEVRLHPDDLEPVQRELARLIRDERLRLHPDEQVSRGGCLLQAECGTVDATLETATAAMTAAVQPTDTR